MTIHSVAPETTEPKQPTAPSGPCQSADTPADAPLFEDFELDDIEVVESKVFA